MKKKEKTEKKNKKTVRSLYSCMLSGPNMLFIAPMALLRCLGQQVFTVAASTPPTCSSICLYSRAAFGNESVADFGAIGSWSEATSGWW